MIGKAKDMLAKLFHSPTGRERPNPDPIAAHAIIARQRNERAGENARQALAELLDANDGLRRTGK